MNHLINKIKCLIHGHTWTKPLTRTTGMANGATRKCTRCRRMEITKSYKWVKNIMLVLFLLIPFVVLGQEKQDIPKVNPEWSIRDKIQYNPFGGTNPQISLDTSLVTVIRDDRFGAFGMSTNERIYVDTTACWLKEAKVYYNTVIEHWVKGYKCKEREWHGFTFDGPYIPKTYYLYSDRKTPVDNPVLYSIPRN